MKAVFSLKNLVKNKLNRLFVVMSVLVTLVAGIACYHFFNRSEESQLALPAQKTKSAPKVSRPTEQTKTNNTLVVSADISVAP